MNWDLYIGQFSMPVRDFLSLFLFFFFFFLFLFLFLFLFFFFFFFFFLPFSFFQFLNSSFKLEDQNPTYLLTYFLPSCLTHSLTHLIQTTLYRIHLYLTYNIARANTKHTYPLPRPLFFFLLKPISVLDGCPLYMYLQSFYPWSSVPV